MNFVVPESEIPIASEEDYVSDLNMLISRENDKTISQKEMDQYLDKKFGKSQFST